MPFERAICPQCFLPAEVEKEFSIADKNIARLKCNHVVEASTLKCSSPEHIVSLDGKHLYPFQCAGVRFILESEGLVLVGDEMGLGKTVQAIGAIISDPKEYLPALFIVKAALKTQWQKEFMRWGGEEMFAQVIDSPKDSPFPGFPGYIVSYDILRRFAEVARKSKTDKGIEDQEIGEDRFRSYTQETEKSQLKGKLVELIEKLKIKTIILDECQQIKNPESQRSIYVREICKHVPHVIAMSGTPIMNNASEFWSVLNILRPDEYRYYSQFITKDCDSYFNGYGYKTGGLRDPERFREKTKSFIIRRTRKEVLPDLPEIQRSYQFHELAKEVEKAYIEEFKKFRDEYNSIDNSEMGSFEESGNLLAFMSRMRYLTGLSKINPCIDHVMEVMGSTNDRITIFTHHKDVAEILVQKLNNIFAELNIPNCARHEAGSSALDTERDFEKTRVLVCSTLAGGEGLNLQRLCSRFVMLERQWNPAKEEQAESCFPRPEGLKVDSIDGVYMVAVGTIDELLAEIVERKREIVGKTLDGKAVEWDQSSLMKELAATLASTGGKRWSI